MQTNNGEIEPLARTSNVYTSVEITSCVTSSSALVGYCRACTRPCTHSRVRTPHFATCSGLTFSFVSPFSSSSTHRIASAAVTDDKPEKKVDVTHQIRSDPTPSSSSIKATGYSLPALCEN
jgi:hypothetical protein